MKGVSRLSSWKPPACMNHASTFWLPRSPLPPPRQEPRMPEMASPCCQDLQRVSQTYRMSGLEHAPEAIYPTPYFINKQTAFAGRR